MLVREAEIMKAWMKALERHNENVTNKEDEKYIEFEDKEFDTDRGRPQTKDGSTISTQEFYRGGVASVMAEEMNESSSNITLPL